MNRHQRRRRQRGHRASRPSAGRGIRIGTLGGPLVIILIVVALGAVTLARTLPPSTSERDAIEVTVPVAGATAAAVIRVIDGDTLDVRLDGTQQRVRLFGIDAPERGERCADEATERLQILAGGVVQLVPDERLEDRFGRLLRYLYTADGTFIDEVLVAEGLALAWRDDGRHRDRLVDLEAAAAAGGVGCLWRGDPD